MASSFVSLCILLTWTTWTPHLVAGRTIMVEPGNPSVTMFVREGGSFTLGCKDTMAKPILWSKNGKTISTYGVRRPQITLWVDVQYSRRVTISSLRVMQAGLMDEGVYGCSATEERPITVNVVVLALKTSDAQLSSHWEEKHNEATLRCDPDKAALFDATMHWYKDGQPIEPVEGDTTAMLLDNNRTLYFRDLSYPQDVERIGKYECILRLPQRGHTFAKNAYIKAAAIIENLYAEEDENVILSCSGHSYPKPDITWRKDGHVVTQGTGKYTPGLTEEAHGKFIATLTIRDFEEKDYGNYTCLANSLIEDYELDSSMVLVLDDVYYGKIQTYGVSQAGMVIGILIAIVILIYIGIVVAVIIIILLRKRKDRNEKGERLQEEAISPEEASPMLSVPEHGRPRRDTMSDTHSHDNVPLNMLMTSPPEPDSDESRNSGDQHDDDDDDSEKKEHSAEDDSDSDDSIHKEKIPTSAEDSGSSSPDHSPVFIQPPSDASDQEEDNNNVPNGVDEPDAVFTKPEEKLTSPPKPVRQGTLKNRPPSVEDILSAERDSKHLSQSLSSSDEDNTDALAPPLPPKKKERDTEYLDMTGSLGRGSRYSTPSRNGSRKLGDSPLPKDDDSSIDGDPHGETEAVIEPNPKETPNKQFSTFV